MRTEEWKGVGRSRPIYQEKLRRVVRERLEGFSELPTFGDITPMAVARKGKLDLVTVGCCGLKLGRPEIDSQISRPPVSTGRRDHVAKPVIPITATKSQSAVRR